MLRFIRKKGTILVFDGFLFKINKRKREIVHFKCCNQNCPTRMALNIDFSSVINFPGNHNHEKPEQQIEETVFKEKVLAANENNPPRRLKEISDEKLQASSSKNIPSYSKIRSSMSRARTRTLTPIPQNNQDIEIDGDWSKTFKGYNLFLHLDRDMGVAIVCTENESQYFSRSTVIFLRWKL